MRLHKCNCKFVPPAVLENLAKEGIEPARAFKIPIPTMAKARGCCIGSAIIVAVALGMYTAVFAAASSITNPQYHASKGV